MRTRNPRNTKMKADTGDISKTFSTGNIKTEYIQVY